MKTQHGVMLVLLLTGLGLASLASAGHREVRPALDNGRYDTARVMDVDPIIRQVTVSVPQRECWDEQITYQRPYRQHSNAAGNMIIGGILGGVIGNRFGEGHGKDIATVAGTLIGASVGHDMASRNSRHGYGTETVTQHNCRVNHVQTVEERVESYRVTYRYQGETYVTHLPYDPGNHLRIQVQVSPADKRRF